MTAFHWHDHHFINRHPALDFANMVVWRNRPERREDRGQSSENLRGWANYAGLKPPSSGVAECTAVREAIDGYFRSGTGWPQLVALYAETLKDDRDPFLNTVLHSAIGLAFSPEKQRVRVCGNCGWLFIDRTRNANKRWCTADICGSRAKARRYYEKKRQASPSSPPSKI
ncbi:CGNR zinc finger domain-containing protein [Taklimakanibacter lacteus]|uniref:CGNR zinc finger domain-containing protein n=1 Tax=Taklimakanibacter lacteus TaxID=2268456 RepID=UPI000E668822